MALYHSIFELVGNTPLLELAGYEKLHGLKGKIYAKLEFYEPNQSVKDRIAVGIIEDAEKAGIIKPGDTLVDFTSGNTGIGYAGAAASRGYKLVLYMQDGVSAERTEAVKALGAQVEPMSSSPEINRALTEHPGDLREIDKALNEIADRNGWYYLNQGGNPSNPAFHYRTTGPEIWKDTNGEVAYYIAGVGTGGSLSGTGKYLKEQNPAVKVIGAQPTPEALPSPEVPDPLHFISGVHPFADVPANDKPINLDESLLDGIYKISGEEAFAAVREVAQHDGILVGSSSGMTIAAARHIAEDPANEGKIIVPIVADTGDRYFSTNLFYEK